MEGKKAAPKTKMVIKEPAAAAAPAAKKAKKATMHDKLQKLFEARPKSFLIGQDLPPKRDLRHFVKWPKYVRLQREKRILLNRLKTPPSLNLFNHTLDKATTVQLFKLMNAMRPEELKARQKRRIESAKAIAEAVKDKKDAKEKKAAYAEALKSAVAKRPAVLKYGLNHVTNLIEKSKAQLVVIAHDVDPIELVVWLPALCRKKKIPFCVIKGKSRLGQLVHKKTCSCIAITNVKKDLAADFAQIVDAVRPQFLENSALLRQWGEGKFGLKHRQAQEKEMRRVSKIEAVKN